VLGLFTDGTSVKRMSFILTAFSSPVHVRSQNWFTILCVSCDKRYVNTFQVFACERAAVKL
jgi:hypothetical protein